MTVRYHQKTLYNFTISLRYTYGRLRTGSDEFGSDKIWRSSASFIPAQTTPERRLKINDNMPSPLQFPGLSADFGRKTQKTYRPGVFSEFGANVTDTLII